MPLTIRTSDGELAFHECKDGDPESSAWVPIYEEAFPPGQRQDVADVRARLRDGSMELDEARDDRDDVLCMTLTEVFGPRAGPEAELQPNGPAFLLACYTATRPELRSLGIGSAHRRRLVELLRGEYPEYLGFFSEIESTREPGLAPEVREIRLRRRAFFLRLGVEPIAIDYRFPSFDRQAPALQGELLWIPFGAGGLDAATLANVLTRIYVEGYGLAPSDPFIATALAAAGCAATAR